MYIRSMRNIRFRDSYYFQPTFFRSYCWIERLYHVYLAFKASCLLDKFRYFMRTCQKSWYIIHGCNLPIQQLARQKEIIIAGEGRT